MNPDFGQMVVYPNPVMFAVGLAVVVEYTKSMDLQEDEGVLALGSIIVGLHKLLEHPQPTNQVGIARPSANIEHIIEHKSQ